MTKIIVEMEMPNSCFDCPCLNGESGFCQADKQQRYIYNDIPKWCPIKGEISEIELMHLEEERAFAERNIEAERKEDGR